MAIIAAAIAGAGALGGGALASSGSKKGGSKNKGEEMLAKIAAQLFSETGPLRETTIGQAMSALTTGQPSAVGSALAQTQTSNIQAQGSKQKQQTQEQFTRAGLDNSSVAIQAQEDIDRAISNLISSAQGADVKALTELGRSIGFGAIPNQAVAASGQLAGLQQQQSLFGQQQAGQLGSASGSLAGLILQKYIASNAGGTPPSGFIYNPDYGYGAGLVP